MQIITNFLGEVINQARTIVNQIIILSLIFYSARLVFSKSGEIRNEARQKILILVCCILLNNGAEQIVQGLVDML